MIPLSTTHNANYFLFTNMQDPLQQRQYWTARDVGEGAGLYSMVFGGQNPNAPKRGWFIGFPSYAWAVRDGDVAAVPVPAAVWLMGSALAGLALFGRRRVA